MAHLITSCLSRKIIIRQISFLASLFIFVHLIVPPNEASAGVTLTPEVQYEVDKLNDLIRGELSAIAIYQRSLSSYEDPKKLELFNRLIEDHKRAAKILTSRVVELEGIPLEDAGRWITMAKASFSSARIFGENSGISVLIKGEEFALSSYSALSADLKVREPTRILSENFAKNEEKYLAELSAVKN